jgi:hypothetical protein
VSDELDQANDMLNDVVARFMGGRPVKRKRARPNRCIDCGRVTRHVRCHECSGATSCHVCKWRVER